MVVRYSCILCGIGILSRPLSESEEWLREYRAVYRKGADVFVSGVAQYHDDPSWIVPVDPNLRWDTVLDPNGLVEIPVMSQPAVDGIHGFVLHDACWCLLQKAGGASAFSKERLVEVCQSLPFTVGFNGASWGHDYGGRLKLDTEVWYPWKEIFRALAYEELERLGFLEDPFRGSDLKLALNGRFPASHASKDDVSNFDAPLEPQGRADCFSRLPWELPNLELSSAPMHSTTTTEMQVPPGPVIIGIAMVNTGIWDYITGIRIISKAGGQEQFAGFAFDSGEGYKITALSVYCDKIDSTTSCEPKDTNLRHTAVWYPKVPPEDLVLNDGSFTGLRLVSTTYQPISWIKFGGQRGKNLPHVKGVMIKFDNASLSGLQFVYDCDVPETGNAASESFGRCGPSKMEGASLFSIDGAAGERITSISVGLAVYENPDYPEHLRHGIIQYLTMSTNFDRTTSLGKKKDGFRMGNLDVASGTTITGFYGHFVSLQGRIVH
ncbi:hypothetical protein ACQRIU_005235 [Beauveria bassiana]